MSLVVRPRSAVLARFVESLGYYDEVLASRRERVLPTGRVSLMVNLYEDEFRTYEGPDETVSKIRGAMLAGPRARYAVIDTDEQRCLIGVNFRLGGSASFFAAPSWTAGDELVELGDLWGRDGAVLRERVLEARTPEARLEVIEDALLEQLDGPSEPDPAVVVAGRAFECGASVSEVTSRLGFLPKRFAERFRAHVGLSPKRYSRVRRLQRLLRGIQGAERVDWCETAADHGYADQAHLIHDFRELTGMTPTAYRPRSSSQHNHVPVDRAG